MKLAKNKAKAKQHPKAELSLFEIFRFFHQRYHPKMIRYILKNVLKTSTLVLMRLYD